MQSSCMGMLMELAEKDHNVLYITADSGEGGLDKLFRLHFPDRSFDFGIAEENMVASAAGLATAGKIPFVYTAAPFLAYRSFEFIRNDICLQNLNVKLIGTGSGLSVSSLGPTHHTTEDIAVLRSLPNLMILSPATPYEAAACVKKAYEHIGPVYIRMGMNREAEFFTADYSFDCGQLERLREGKDVCIVSTGSILSEVIKAAELLKEKNIQSEIVNVPMLKPFAENDLLSYTDEKRLLVSVEEHNVLGGLGSIISEIITSRGIGQKLLRIGLRDVFSVGYGRLSTIRKENNVDASAIAKKILETLT